MVQHLDERFFQLNHGGFSIRLAFRVQIERVVEFTQDPSVITRLDDRLGGIGPTRACVGESLFLT